jgi:1-acyl-sn-glycerol-3-phosphate acyltransferase
MQFVRSVLFTAFMFAWSLLYAMYFVVASPFVPLKQRFAMAAWYAHRMLGGLRLLCALDYRVEGLENLPAQPHVMLWKHGSAWETFAQFLIGPPKVLVLKRELILIPFFGWGLKLLHSIAINRGAGASAVNQVVNQGMERLAEGLSVLVFPEGTRMPAGETRKYGVSGTLLAIRAGCPVVPVAHDAGYYWPRRGLLKQPGTVRVVIGPPIETAGRDAREINTEVQAWIEAQVKRSQAEVARFR